MERSKIEDLRALAVMLTAKINNMCNVTTTEDVSNEFIAAKDLLISVYKLNVERVSK